VLAGLDIQSAGGQASVGIALWDASQRQRGTAGQVAQLHSISSLGSAGPGRIRFTLQNQEHVLVEVFNVRGQRVRVVADSDLPVGGHIVEWDGRDAARHPAASGIYFWKVTSGNEQRSLRGVLIR